MLRHALLGLLGLGLLIPAADAQSSLFDRDRRVKPIDRRTKPVPALTLYNDPVEEKKLYYKHDLITVQILEITRGNASANTTVRRETDIQVELNKFLKLKGFSFTKPGDTEVVPALGIEQAKPGIDITSEYERIGFGQTRRDQQLTGQITAEVIKVLPNGSLVIEARKVRQVSDDTETMVLSGIIRPDDVGKDNIVLSHRIARLTVRYTAKGPTNDAQRPGLLSKVAEYIWPF